MIGWVPHLVLAMGCPRQSPPPPPPFDLPAPAPDGVQPIERRNPVRGGEYWTEPGGLCLEVPDAWSGTSGPEPRLLDLVNEPTGVRFEVYAWAEGSPDPAEGPGWVLAFEDDEGYRTVPILSPASTATWHTEQDDGPTRQTWSGSLGERSVRVAATYPFGSSVVGRDAVEPLLRALCTTFQ